MILAAIDWSALGKAGYTSALGGLAVLLIAALAVGSSLLAQDSRARSGGTATAYLAGTAVCLLGLAAIVVYGIYLMTDK